MYILHGINSGVSLCASTVKFLAGEVEEKVGIYQSVRSSTFCFTLNHSCASPEPSIVGLALLSRNNHEALLLVTRGIEVASVIELSEVSGRVAAGLFMTEG